MHTETSEKIVLRIPLLVQTSSYGIKVRSLDSAVCVADRRRRNSEPTRKDSECGSWNGI